MSRPTLVVAGASPEYAITLPNKDAGGRTNAPSVSDGYDPDKAWARLYKVIWDDTDYLVRFSRSLRDNEVALFNRFFTEWKRVVADRDTVGPTLYGNREQKLATVARVSTFMLHMLRQAKRINLPMPKFAAEDVDWVMLGTPEPMDTVSGFDDEVTQNALRMTGASLAARYADGFYPFCIVVLNQTGWQTYPAESAVEAYQKHSTVTGADTVYTALYEYENSGRSKKPRKLRETFPKEKAEIVGMNSRDPWRAIIGAPHHHHGGGGGHHHHHGGGGRRRFYGGGWGGWGWPYPDYDPVIIINNSDDEAELFDRWGRRVDRYGRVIAAGEAPKPAAKRDGLLADVAPVLAPASGGVAASMELDKNRRLTVRVTVDDQTYVSSMDLGPQIDALMANLAKTHKQWHAGQDTQVGKVYSPPQSDCDTLIFRCDRTQAKDLLDSMRQAGYTVTGSNPYKIDTHNHEVVLEAAWLSDTNSLSVTIIHMEDAFYITCSAVWDKILGELAERGVRPWVSGATLSAPGVVRRLDRAVQAAGDTMIDALVEQHIGCVCAGWFDSVKKGVRGVAKNAGKIRKTLKKYSGPIANAAGLAAGSAAGAFGGPAAGLVANKLANKLVHAAAGEGSAKAALAEARDDAKRDPKLAKALGAAEKAVAQTTAAYHIAETAKAAATGDGDAVQDIAKLADAASRGDKAAQVAMKLATDAAATTNGTTVSGAIPFASLNEYRRVASHAVKEAASRKPAAAIGYRRDGNRQRIYFFPTVQDASEWVATLDEGSRQMPTAPDASYDYVAAYDTSDLRGPFTEQVGGFSPTVDAHTATGEIINRISTAVDPGTEELHRDQAPTGRPKQQVRDSGHAIKIQALTFEGEDAGFSVAWHPTLDQMKRFGGKAQPLAFMDGVFLFEDRKNGQPIESGPWSGIRVTPYQPTWKVEMLDANVSGELVSGENGPRPLIRVPVLDEAGALTNLHAMWVLPGTVPNFYWEGPNGDAWLYLDQNGDTLVADKRYKAVYATIKATIMGDRLTSRKSPELVPAQPPVATVGTGGPRVEIIGAALDAMRKQASDAVRDYPNARIVGVVRWSNGQWALEPFATADDADDWFGETTNQPSLFTYVAYFDKGDKMFPNPLNERVGHAQPNPVAKAS